jgi:hypothetical protein
VKIHIAGEVYGAITQVPAGRRYDASPTRGAACGDGVREGGPAIRLTVSHGAVTPDVEITLWKLGRLDAAENAG